MPPAPRRRARSRTRIPALATLPALLLSLGLTAPAQAASGAVTYDVRVLVIDDGSPMVGAIADRLTLEGQPFDRIDLTAADRPAITADSLATGGRSGITAKYTGIVTPNEAPSGLSADERSTLQAYGSTFKVREVAAYTWAHPEVGLNYAANPGYVGPVDGMTASLTPEAKSGPFAYLDGSLTFDDIDPAVDESWGYLATPLPATSTSSFTPLVTAPIPGSDQTGSLVGVHRNGEHERMILTVGVNEHQQHWKVLSHGVVSWLTRDVSLTYQRNWFSSHIDDVLMASNMWSEEGDCTIGDGCDPALFPADAPGATVRMTAADVDHLVAWQRESGIKLDMTYNALGATEAKQRTGAPDPLEDALLAQRPELRWINHTWSHLNLGCVQDFSTIPWSCVRNADGSIKYRTGTEITDDIRRGQDYARTSALTGYRDDVLVTGQHSGLKTLPQMEVDNPNLAGALQATGIRWIASDASRETEPRPVGPATTVPRYPMNIFYNNAYEAQAVDEYNWIYTARAAGGSGICEDNPATTTCIEPLDPATDFDDTIVPLEARIALGHVLDNDPRPHFSHQANLAGDRILYPVIDTMNASYRGLFADNAPLLNPTMQDAGAELVRQATWRTQQADVQATISGSTLTVRNTGSRSVTVPITVPEGSHTATAPRQSFGTAYAGQRSETTAVPARGTAQVSLAAQPGLATSATWPAAPSAPALTPQLNVERQEPTTDVPLPEAVTVDETQR